MGRRGPPEPGLKVPLPPHAHPLFQAQDVLTVQLALVDGGGQGQVGGLHLLVEDSDNVLEHAQLPLQVGQELLLHEVLQGQLLLALRAGCPVAVHLQVASHLHGRLQLQVGQILLQGHGPGLQARAQPGLPLFHELQQQVQVGGLRGDLVLLNELWAPLPRQEGWSVKTEKAEGVPGSSEGSCHQKFPEKVRSIHPAKGNLLCVQREGSEENPDLRQAHREPRASQLDSDNPALSLSTVVIWNHGERHSGQRGGGVILVMPQC